MLAKIDGSDGPRRLDLACIRSAGERLAFLRASAGLTLAKAAESSGISQSELSRLENDSRRLSSDHLFRLARTYGVALETVRDILEFDPLRDRFVGVPPQPPRDAAPAEVDCFDAAEVRRVGLSEQPFERIEVPGAFGLGKRAYALRLVEGLPGALIPPGGIALVNPDRRSVLGDLVVNAVSWDPLFMTVDRDEAGQLVGHTEIGAVPFPPSVAVSAFHKVVALLPAPHALGD